MSLCISRETKRSRDEPARIASNTGDMTQFLNLSAFAEQMLIHVNLSSRSASEPSPQVSERLQAISAAHTALGKPEGCGRAIGDPP